MAGLVIDFTNVVTGGSPVSEGTHLVALFDAKMTTTKNGDPMIKVTWKCQPDDPDAGRQVFDQYPIMDSTLWKVKLFFEGLGEDVSGAYDIQARLPELIGTVALIEVEHESYDNPKTGKAQIQARVTAINPVREGETPVLTAATPRRGGKKNPF